MLNYVKTNTRAYGAANVKKPEPPPKEQPALGFLVNCCCVCSVYSPGTCNQKPPPPLGW